MELHLLAGLAVRKFFRERKKKDGMRTHSVFGKKFTGCLPELLSELDQAEDHLAFFSDHILVPGWIPDDVHFGFSDAGD